MLLAVDRSIYTVYQPCKVVVLDLDPAIQPHHLEAYFENFGEVVDVTIKPRISSAYAFIKFSTENAVSSALSMAPHMIQRRHVRVMRAFKPTHQRTCPLPDKPQPADPCAPVAEAGQAPSVWLYDTTLWDMPLFKHVLMHWQ